MPPGRTNEIVLGARAVSADTALRLGRYFGMEPKFWMHLRAPHDLETARDAPAGRLEREVEARTA